MIITEPGVYDLKAEQYHRDPVEGGSLSSSGARLLLPPSCPAKFRHYIEHGGKHRDVYDFGHVAHALVLGKGEEIVIVDAKDWRTKAAQEQKTQAYAEGKAPILICEFQKAKAMAAAVRDHPLASRLLSPEYMTPEQTLVWRDEETGIWCRAMLDGLPLPDDDRLMIIPDYKTSTSAEPRHVRKAIADYGYHCQAQWYSDGVRALGLADDPEFAFIVQEKEPPYLISVVVVDDESRRIAAERNRKARSVFAHCMATDTWPSYTDEVVRVGLPGWAVAEHEAAFNRGEFDIDELEKTA